MNQETTYKPSDRLERSHRLLSLFSGCGGMDLGFEGDFEVYQDCLSDDCVRKGGGREWIQLPKTNFQTVFANDIMSDACKAWQNYFCAKYGYSPETYRLASIVDLVKLHQNKRGIFPGNIDIVTGGFPCQDFSVAGKRRGFYSFKDHKGRSLYSDIASGETRGELYMWMKEVIEIVNPKIFIAENVKGLVSMENAKELIQRDFSSAGGDGYIVLPPQVLHAARYGVPQSRERVIFIGIRRSALNAKALSFLSQPEIPDAYNPYPLASHQLPGEDKGLKPAVQIGRIFASLVEPENSLDHSQRVYSRAKYMGVHCQGQKEINLKGLAPTIRSEHHGNIEYRRLNRVNGGVIVDELNRGLIERRLTPRECALIQTFPRDYEFVIPSEARTNRYVVSPSAAYRIIGNAVPPLLAYHISRRLEELWSLYFS